jgi:hypothetical protein
MFGHDNIEFLLYYYHLNHTEKDEPFNWILRSSDHAKEVEKYNIFKDEFLSVNGKKEKNKSDQQVAKLSFQKLRKLQQQLEQLVNDTKKYNYLALILNLNKNSDRVDLINYYKEKNWETMRSDVRYFLLDPKVKLDDIQKQKDISIDAYLFIEKLNASYVYDKEVRDDQGNMVSGAYEEMYRTLLWMNVEEEVHLGENSDTNRTFDFHICESGNRSLEHIYPKGADVKLDFLKNGKESAYTHLTVHSAGNLVLLYTNENSEFWKKSPSEKKKIYFDFTHKFKSRNLMHSIMVFAKRDHWAEKEIIENQKEFIKKLIKIFFGTHEKFEVYKQLKTSQNHE